MFSRIVHKKFAAKVFILLLLLSSFFIYHIYTTITQSKTAYIQDAEEAYKLGEYAQAISLYKRILISEPQNQSIHQKIAHTYRYWGKYTESEEWFLKALAIDPENPTLLTDLGKLYKNTGEYQKAEEVFHKSLAIEPNNAGTYSYGLGYLYFEQQRFAEAEQMFLEALVIDPKNELAYSGLGDTYREMKRYDESELMYTKVFEINPNSESYLGLGWLYIQQNRHKEAIEPLTLFLKNIREKAEVYYTLGIAYEGAGEIENARHSLTRSVELNPDDELFQSAYAAFTERHPSL